MVINQQYFFQIWPHSPRGEKGTMISFSTKKDITYRNLFLQVKQNFGYVCDTYGLLTKCEVKKVGGFGQVLFLRI